MSIFNSQQQTTTPPQNINHFQTTQPDINETTQQYTTFTKVKHVKA